MIDEPCCARTGADRVLHAVDRHPRTELPDAAIGVAPGQHLEDQLELAPFQIPIRVGGSQERVQRLYIPILGYQHGEHHLGEHIEGACDGTGLLDLLFQNALSHHRGVQEVTIEEGIEPALARRSDLVTGPT